MIEQFLAAWRRFKTALLVIDIQNDFVHPQGWAARHGGAVAGMRKIFPAVNGLIDVARRAGVDVVFIKTEHGPGVDAANYRARYSMRGMDDAILCAAGTWGAEFDADLRQPERDEAIVCKHSYDAFCGTDLDAFLRARDIEAVVATGVATNLCVQTTIHHAFGLGYFVGLVEDGTAATFEAEQDAMLSHFRRFFGTTAPSRDWASVWTDPETRPSLESETSYA